LIGGIITIGIRRVRGIDGLIYPRIVFGNSGHLHLTSRSTLGDKLQTAQQCLDPLLQQFSGAIPLFIVRENVKDSTELFDLFLYAPDLSKNRLNLVQRLRVFTEREISLFNCCDQLREILDALPTTNKDLNAARITDEIWLCIFVFPLLKILNA
jgi:hypothetical protein